MTAVLSLIGVAPLLTAVRGLARVYCMHPTHSASRTQMATWLLAVKLQRTER
jgi:hypothetical protein